MHLNIWAWICSFFISTLISKASLFEKAEIELELLTDIDMILIAEKGIRGGICHVIHGYATANNKYMGKYNKNK